MKFPHFIPLLVVFSLSMAVAETAADSLMSNGDFETSLGWPVGKGITIEEDSGNHFLRLESTEPGTQIQAYRKITIPGGLQKLAVNFRVNHTNIKPGAENWHTGRVIMHFKDANGQVLKPDPKPFSFVGESNGWIEKSVEIPVPEGAVEFEFMPALFQVAMGTLEIDDVTIVPVDA